MPALTPTGKRSHAQIVKDERAVTTIAEAVRKADRWDVTSLRQVLDEIGDALVAAGRL